MDKEVYYPESIGMTFWKINLNTRTDGSESGIKTINMTIFEACSIFFQFLEAKPCHQR